ncbi:fructosamine kinase family protein [Methyloceanibacter sp.]|uniref:fructosamine kinase family protein n=1 Tax=Methyloceanibacter sp. TaxID=1965321 RepID=UPI003D6D4D94
MKDRLEAALGVGVTSLASMPVGFGLAGFKADLADGRKVAVKARQGTARADLRLEAYMLGELARHSTLPVPAVHLSEPDLLVMDFIETDGGGITPQVERHAAELIAALHAVPRPFFGYARDTLIGPLPQPNPQMDRWIPFFRDHRLLAMARTAEAEGRLPAKLLMRLERLAGRLDTYLTEPRHPSLLHGDVWTGNVLVRRQRIAGFVDPAIYCGHPEIELAFTTMFGTFGPAFFEAYEALLPLEPGFHELRSALYKLYPTLVHVQLFGSAYLPPIERTLAGVGL